MFICIAFSFDIRCFLLNKYCNLYSSKSGILNLSGLGYTLPNERI